MDSHHTLEKETIRSLMGVHRKQEHKKITSVFFSLGGEDDTLKRLVDLGLKDLLSGT